MPRRPGIALTAAALGVLALFADWVLAFHVGFTMRIDRHVLEGFAGLDHGPIGRLADVIPHLSDPKPFVVFGTAVVAVALVRGRRALAVGALALLLGSNLCTQWLKPPLSVHRDSTAVSPVDISLWPSGHATASMALCLAAALVAPAVRRPLVAGIGAAYSLAVTFTLLVGAWHFPSDVIAGYLMAGTWAAMVVAAMWWRDARENARVTTTRPADVRRALKPPVAVGALGIALVALVTLARPQAVADYARDHTAFVVGAAVIAVLALALATAFSAALSGTRRSADP